MAKLFDKMGIAVVALVDSEGIVSNYDMRNMMDIFGSHSDEVLEQAFDVAWRSDEIKTLDDFEKVLDKEEVEKEEESFKYRPKVMADKKMVASLSEIAVLVKKARGLACGVEGSLEHQQDTALKNNAIELSNLLGAALMSATCLELNIEASSPIFSDQDHLCIIE